ncbi:MAG: VWA domain-containing protein [Pyrinomonadaceae bacterium]|nr:VWA domain-containing protein [Pyrinomonadaceae bacterium]
MSARRLPVYLLIDTSGSMKGEPIESVNTGLQSMLSYLRQDPFALESVYLSIITFDREVKQVLPLTELESVVLPKIQTPESGPTHLGAALEMLCETVDREVVKSDAETKGDWMPLLFIMTDGSPSDIQLFNEQVPEIKRRNFGNIIACAAGPKAKDSYLQQITESVVHLDTTDSATFQQFFKWVSASVSVGNRSLGASAVETALPPPPPEIQIVY